MFSLDEGCFVTPIFLKGKVRLGGGQCLAPGRQVASGTVQSPQLVLCAHVMFAAQRYGQSQPPSDGPVLQNAW